MDTLNTVNTTDNAPKVQATAENQYIHWSFLIWVAVIVVPACVAVFLYKRKGDPTTPIHIV
jgi:hypothetical protein